MLDQVAFSLSSRGKLRERDEMYCLSELVDHVRMVVYLADGGSLVPMCDQGYLGLESGLRRASGGQVENFTWAHTKQALKRI